MDYLAKDTRNKRFVPMQYTNEEFVDLLLLDNLENPEAKKD